MRGREYGPLAGCGRSVDISLSWCTNAVVQYGFSPPIGLSRIHTLTKEKVMYYGGVAGIVVLVLVFLLWSGRF
jgi:hypothetical protein